MSEYHLLDTKCVLICLAGIWALILFDLIVNVSFFPPKMRKHVSDFSFLLWEPTVKRLDSLKIIYEED